MKEKILKALNDKMMSSKELYYFFKNKYLLEDIESILSECVLDYELMETKKGRFGPLNKFNFYKGVIRKKDKGFGFLETPFFNEDIFIPRHNLPKNVLDGDIVLANVFKESSNGKRAEGKITKVLRRDLITYSGSIVRIGNEGKQIKINGAFYPGKASDYKNADIGDIVSLKIIDYNKKGYYKTVINEVIGNIKDLYVDIKQTAFKYGFEEKFPEDVIEEVSNIYDRYTLNKEEEFSKRRKVTDVITIDGKSAKDLDDAIKVNKLENGNYKLGVYIADVSFFVSKDSKLDQEALSRGTSVYLASVVIPMLPKLLSNDLCSLNEGENKLAMACEMEIDPKGKVVDYQISEVVISSSLRANYTDVNTVFDCIKANDVIPDSLSEYQKHRDMFQDILNLKRALHSMRKKRGSLEFDIPESKLHISDTGIIENISLVERKDSEKAIEEFMLIANETVAKAINLLELPFIYRVHDEPDEQKLFKFKKILSNTKYSIQSFSKKTTPKSLQRLLENIENDDPGLSAMLLRLMSKAVYSHNNLGHYGLASDCYTHFTSPIRRYPDLLVHRLIKEYIINSEEFYSLSTNSDYLNELELDIASIAQKCSKQEQKAVACEYEVLDMKKAEYMQQFIGKEFTGRISSVTGFGMFVRLDNTVEGLIRTKNLKDDYYEYKEDIMSLVGKRGHKVFRLGDEVKIKVIDSSKEKRQIDFKLIQRGKKKNGKKYKHKGGRKK